MADSREVIRMAPTTSEVNGEGSSYRENSKEETTNGNGCCFQIGCCRKKRYDVQKGNGKTSRDDSDTTDMKADLFQAAKSGNICHIKKLFSDPTKIPTDKTTGNSICHIAAKHGIINVIEEYGSTLISQFTNKVGDTWLHAAAEHDKHEIVEFIMKKFTNVALKHSLKNDKNELLALAKAVPDPKIRTQYLEFIQNLENEVETDSRRKEQKISDKQLVEKNKVSSLTGTDLDDIVSHLAFHLLYKNREGDTALHTAAKNSNSTTLRTLVERSAPITQVTNLANESGETVLHIAMKVSDADTVEFLIKHGADLAVRDKTKNTPLHDLVDIAASSEDNLEQYVNIWKTVVKNAAFWWCSKISVEHDQNECSNEYKDYQRDAVYYLRSEIPNEHGLSVIQLAASQGLVRLVREMIWVHGVFVKQINLDNNEIEILNVTNLMPHLTGGTSIQYFKKDKGELTHIEPPKPVTENEKSNTSQECCKSGTVEECRCLLDAVLDITHSNKANEIFQIEPMDQMVKDYWFVHQWWTVVTLLAHLTFMAFYSSYSLDNILDIYSVNGTHGPSINQLYIIWPLTLVVPDIIVWAVLPLYHRATKKPNKDNNKNAWEQYVKHVKRVIDEVNTDYRDIINWPSIILSTVVMLLALLMPHIFCITTTIGLQFLDSDVDTYSYMTIISLVVGWLLTFYWAGAFEPVYRFLRALRFILLKDIISFLFFYLFVLFAFSNAIFAIMSWVPSLVEEYHDLNGVMYELLLVGCGASSRMSSEDVAVEFEKLGYSSLMFKVLFTSYIFITLVGLLNLVIASMCDTYANFKRTDQQGWRQHSLNMSRRSSAGFFVGNKILYPLFKGNIVDKNVWQDKHSGHHLVKREKKLNRKKYNKIE